MADIISLAGCAGYPCTLYVCAHAVLAAAVIGAAHPLERGARMLLAADANFHCVYTLLWLPQ
jgi:hypothetical protein